MCNLQTAHLFWEQADPSPHPLSPFKLTEPATDNQQFALRYLSFLPKERKPNHIINMKMRNLAESYSHEKFQRGKVLLCFSLHHRVSINKEYHRFCCRWKRLLALFLAVKSTCHTARRKAKREKRMKPLSLCSLIGNHTLEPVPTTVKRLCSSSLIIVRYSSSRHIRIKK